MAYDPKDLYSVLLFIKDQYGVEIFEDNKAVSILMDLAPELKRDSKVLQKLIDNKLIETLVNLDDQSRESEIKRIEMLLEDRELIHPEISDYCVRTVVDVFNKRLEEKITDIIEEKTEPLLVKKEEKQHTKTSKPYIIRDPYFKDNKRPPISKPKRQYKHPILKVLLMIGAVFCIVIGVGVIEQEKDNQVTGLTEIVDPAKDYSRYLGQDIYTAASEINSTEPVNTIENSGAYYSSDIGAEENFNITLSAPGGGHIINDITLYDNLDQPNDGSNILGITTGMSKSEAEKVLKDQGFEIEPYNGNLSANKDNYSITVAIEDHKVDYVSISNYSL